MSDMYYESLSKLESYEDVEPLRIRLDPEHKFLDDRAFHRKFDRHDANLPVSPFLVYALPETLEKT
jgi:hypothetical protein